MTIVQKEWFSTKQCLENPQNLYVFGDNTLRVGKRGQAQIRDCENSFGVVTKYTPSTYDDAYFSDAKEEGISLIISDLERLNKIKNQYTNIVFPHDGLGTGLSEMPTRCPKTFEVMNEQLMELFGFKNKE